MPSPPKKEAPGQFQKGFHAVPISETDAAGALRLGVVLCDAPDPVSGAFVLLRDTLEASVYLGCLLDAGGHVHNWIELWVQNVNSLETTLETHREAFSNHLLDERWKKRAGFLSRIDRSNKIECSFESAHPLPIYFDLNLSAPVNPKPATSSAPWELCVDDTLLAKHGLPAYTTSLARYLYVPQAPEPTFLPVTSGSPESEATQEPQQALGPLIPLNPDGALMMARKFAPLSLEAYVDVVAGQPWKGLDQGSKVFRLPGVYRTLQNADSVQQGGGHLFLGKRGRAGRLIETFHLKLDLLLQIFRLTRDFVREEQLPFLNLSADSFRVTLADIGQTLPYLWTQKASLSVFGSAFALPVETSDARYFVAPGTGTTSIYNPVTPTAAVSATGAVRIRKVLSEEDGTFVLEGTISTQERIAISQTDLLWLRLTLSPGRVDFYANLTEGAAKGEQRFRTLPRKLPEHVGPAVHSAEGVRLPNVPFETLPLRSSPCDLHALATIGVRTLLVNDDNTLPVALDEISSLAQAVAADAREGVDFARRLREIGASDSRWPASLGPQRLLNPQSLGWEDALAYLPAELWWDSLAVLVKCFPGLVPDSFCADLGDAPPLALHSVFEPAIEELERLCLRSRSLLFADWKYEAEIRSVVDAALQQHLSELA